MKTYDDYLADVEKTALKNTCEACGFVSDDEDVAECPKCGEKMRLRFNDQPDWRDD